MEEVSLAAGSFSTLSPIAHRPRGRAPGLTLPLYLLYTYIIRALASARGSVARRAQRHRICPLEGPKGPRVAETCESEGPKGPRTSKAWCPFRRLPVLLYVFHNSAQNREFHGLINRLKCQPKLMKIAVSLCICEINIM